MMTYALILLAGLVGGFGLGVLVGNRAAKRSGARLVAASKDAEERAAEQVRVARAMVDDVQDACANLSAYLSMQDELNDARARKPELTVDPKPKMLKPPEESDDPDGV